MFIPKKTLQISIILNGYQIRLRRPTLSCSLRRKQFFALGLLVLSTNQCDQIGRFLQAIWRKLSHKMTQIIWRLFGLFLMMSLICKKCEGNLWEKLDNFLFHHPVASCRAGWIFHPSTSLGSFGSSKQATPCMQAKIMSVLLGIDDFGSWGHQGVCKVTTSIGSKQELN